MIAAYVNYPNPHVTIHAAQDCGMVQMQHKANQRVVRIDTRSVSRELDRFEAREHNFASQSELNDMWLQVDFGDPEFERAVIHYVRRILAKRYSPFSRARVTEHC